MRGGDNRSRETRVNERIRVREVRVIDEDGQMLGVMSSGAALALARERGLDLVEVSPMAVPPVTKILDWGRYKYEQSKKENEARKHQKVTQLREIRMRPRTDEHDVGVKVRKIQEFLTEGDKVKVSVIFRGRELAHPELGRVLLEQVTQELKGQATIERPPIMEGKMMSMIVGRAAGADAARRPVQAGAEAQPAAQQGRPVRPAAATSDAPGQPAADGAAPAPNGGAAAQNGTAPTAPAPSTTTTPLPGATPTSRPTPAPAAQ
jgi:translation initiation factor IF-3